MVREQLTPSAEQIPSSARRRLIAAVAVAVVFGVLAFLGRAGAGATPVASAQTYQTFAHTTAQHARLPCLLCHHREAGATRPQMPGHSPCSGCHAQQFADPASPICAICHTNLPSPQVKPFPSLRSFSVRFDHARHNAGGSRPRAGCVACHKPTGKGAALSIPSGFGAHATCYQCHAATARSGERDISSCGVCHAIGGYSRTPVNVRAFTLSFSHAKHVDKGLRCAECHTVRAGAGQRRQVASPLAAQHNVPAKTKSCASCHDGTRAFGGDNFADCKRCHQGETWRF